PVIPPAPRRDLVVKALCFDVTSRRDTVPDGRKARAQAVIDGDRRLRRAAVTGQQGGQRLAVLRSSQYQVAREFVGDRVDEVVVKAKELARVPKVERPRDHPAEWMEGELEGRDDTEVAAASSQSPEQVGVLVGRRRDPLAGGGDEVGADEVVARQPEQPAQNADSAPEREARHPRGGYDPARGREPVGLGGRVEIAPARAALDTGAPP